MRDLLLIVTILLFQSPAQARWMRSEEADVAVESSVTHVQVAADGRSESVATVRLKILNENGRRDVGTIRFNYGPKNYKVKVVRASVRTDGKTVKVRDDNIADQPIRGSEVGFDDVRQVLVSFPQVQVGSELTYELRDKVIKPEVGDHWSTRFNFGAFDLEKEVEKVVESERPLYMSVNDPGQNLEIKSSRMGKKHVYSIRLKRPVLFRLFDERRGLLPDKAVSWVVMSTAPDHVDMFGKLAGRYEKLLEQPLPPKFAELREQAKSEKDPIAKINKVLAGLADRVRYMGDWRPVDGGFVPRPLEQIAETQSGDCKDMSLVTTKILRELGFNAWIALVQRGTPAREVPTVPYLGFNHAIVHVHVGDRKLWLDPTNFQAFAQGVFEDIGDRKSLVMNPEKMALETVEFTPPAENTETVDYKVRVKSDSVVTNEIDLVHTGAIALNETGALLRYSRPQFEEGTLTNLTSRSEVIRYKIDLPELRSRVVAPVTIKIQVEKELHPNPTSAGPALAFPAWPLTTDLRNLDRAKTDGDFQLGPPTLSRTIFTLTGLRMTGGGLKNCSVRSPWIDYDFTVKKSPLRLDVRHEIKKYLISNPDLKSDAFTRLQKSLKECVRDKYVVYSRGK